MSDYISKSALIDFMIRNVVTLTEEAHDFKVEMIDAIKKQPTLDEKEIIRKAFERVVEKIDDLETHFDNGDFATCRYSLVVLKDVLRIVKEEGGIK